MKQPHDTGYKAQILNLIHASLRCGQITFQELDDVIKRVEKELSNGDKK